MNGAWEFGWEAVSAIVAILAFIGFIIIERQKLKGAFYITIIVIASLTYGIFQTTAGILSIAYYWPKYGDKLIELLSSPALVKIANLFWTVSVEEFREILNTYLTLRNLLCIPIGVGVLSIFYAIENTHKSIATYFFDDNESQ